jgi:glycosyltransferase involved in cell wall biosynthesis
MQRVLIPKKVSFIMAAFDESDSIITQAINSVRKQSRKNWELIIVLDNPKQERLKKILRSYAAKDKRIKCIFNEKNIGRAASRNKAVNESTGDYLAVLDADDVASPDRVALQSDFLDKHKEISLVFGQAEFIDMQGRVFKSFSPKRKEFENISRTIFSNNPLIHSTMTVRSEVLKTTPYNKIFTRSQDYEFWLRCVGKKYLFSGIEKPIVKYRVSKDDPITRVRKQKDVFKFGLRALLKNFRYFLFNPYYYSMLIRFVCSRVVSLVVPENALARFVKR